MSDPDYSNIWSAAVANRIDEVEELIERGFPINEKSSEGGTLLHLAARLGYYEFAAYLIDTGIDVNFRRDSYGEFGKETALYLAVDANHPQLVELLLQHGAKPDLVSKEGYAPIDLAADRGQMDLVRLLVKGGAKPSRKKSGRPLLNAIAARHFEIAEYLIANGADLNVQCGIYGTILMTAARSKNVSTVEFVLQRAPELLNEVDDKKQNALHCAVASYASRITRYEASEDGRMKEVERVEPEDAIPVIRRLLDAGIDRAVRDQDGYTPLDLAKLFKAKPIIEMLETL